MSINNNKSSSAAQTPAPLTLRDHNTLKRQRWEIAKARKSGMETPQMPKFPGPRSCDLASRLGEKGDFSD